MQIFPAIDLKQDAAGRCRVVRLRQGRADAETAFSDDPPAVAKRWADAGANWLHVVDLDGAFAGKPVNTQTLREIRNSVVVKIQVGGGIRDDAAAQELLDDVGIERVVIGTRALADAEWFRRLCARYPGRILAGIDARNGRVAVDGWTRDSGVNALEAAKTLADCGAAAIIFTDIATDGMMRGPNIQSTKELAESVGVPVIASGGVATIDDVRALAQLHLEGVIIGRALYDNSIDLREAIAISAHIRKTGGCP